MEPSACLLVADDLTGACDAAVHFAARGLRAVVPLAGDAGGACDVAAVSTESRGMEAPGIREAMRATARMAPRRPRILFKKIDSTLRGLAGVEIAAALDAFGCAAAIVCPAFPAVKRVVRGGWLTVAGAGDFAPIDVVGYLRGQGLEASVFRAAGDIASAMRAGASAIVADAACEGDLDRIAAAGLAIEAPVLWAGAGGLAAALARTLPSRAGMRAARGAAGGGVLLAIGSDHRVTLAQQGAVMKARGAELLDASRADALPAGGRHVVLRVPWGRVTAERLRACVAGVRPAAVVLSGGDTASLFCRAAGVERIELIEEIVPGVPCGVLRGGLFDGVRVATKSGGFGEPDALIQVVDYFS